MADFDAIIVVPQYAIDRATEIPVEPDAIDPYQQQDD
jgi:hypothetical protein